MVRVSPLIPLPASNLIHLHLHPASTSLSACIYWRRQRSSAIMPSLAPSSWRASSGSVTHRTCWRFSRRRSLRRPGRCRDRAAPSHLSSPRSPLHPPLRRSPCPRPQPHRRHRPQPPRRHRPADPLHRDQVTLAPSLAGDRAREPPMYSVRIHLQEEVLLMLACTLSLHHPDQL